MDLDKESEDQKFERGNLALNEKEGPIRVNCGSKSMDKKCKAYVYDKCYDVLVTCNIWSFHISHI